MISRPILLTLLLAPAAMAALPVRNPAPAKPQPAPAVAQPLDPEAQARLLAQLEEIESALRGKRNAWNLSLLPRLQEAGTNDDKAFSLWLDATKEIDFDTQGKTATEFSDFRNGKAKALRGDAAFTSQLRLQCRFLTLIILQSNAVSDAERTAVAQGAAAYLEDLISSAKKIWPNPGELRNSALDGVIARHLKLDVSARKGEGPAAYSPGSLSEIYQQMILPWHREKRNAPAITAAWNKRIAQETALVELSKVPEQLEQFQLEKLPELRWGQAKDLFEAGQQETAAASMVSLIRSHLGHRKTAAWIQEVSQLVRNSQASPESAPSTLPSPGKPVPATIPIPAPVPAPTASAPGPLPGAASPATRPLPAAGTSPSGPASKTRL